MNKVDGRVLQLKNRLGSNKRVNNLIKEMAKEFNITPFHLSQLFKKQTGENVIEFDRNLRLNKAKSILETTYKSVKEVCYDVGFNEYAYFLREFKKKYGTSPKKLQKLNWINQAEKITDKDN